MHIVQPIAEGIHGMRPPSFDVQDMVQTGYLALIRAAESFDASTGTPFEAWARLKVRGAIIDSTRRKAYRDSTHAGIEDWHMEMADSRPTAEESMIEGERVKSIRECVEQLPEQQKMVIISRYQHGETLGKIGRRNGMGYSHGITEIHRAALTNVKVSLQPQTARSGAVPRTTAEIFTFLRQPA